jgi:predicted DNA-binding protein (MmcQ/YjbR family)
MAEASRRYTDDVPDEIEARVRTSCIALPHVHEQAAWKGTRWMVRRRTFAQVLGIETDDAGPMVVLAFRSSGEELETLRRTGPPFFVLGWGRDAIGMSLDEQTNWDEVRELVTESYCVMAPNKLVALVDRPVDPGSGQTDRR